MPPPPMVPSPASRELTRWFAEEVQPHEPSLRSYLRSTFPSLSDVDDIVQEAYARLLRARAAAPIAYVKAFLFSTARNAALDLCRRRKVVAMESVGDWSGWFVYDDAPDAATAINRQQELGLLAEAVRALPDRCREVLTLRLLYALPHKEIAARLRISEHTVKAHLAKGMQRCAAFFEERGLLDPARNPREMNP